MRSFVMILLAAEMLCACGNALSKDNSKPLVVVQKSSAAINMENSVYPGQIKGKYESSIAFQASGRIISRHIKLGDFVEKGAVLMALDPADIRESLNISTAQLNEAKSKLQLAETEHERQTRMYQEKIVSQARYEQSLNAVEAARAYHKQAEAQYKQYCNMLEYTVLHAPDSGIITGLSAEAGQVISAGQAVLSLVNTGAYEVELYISERDITAVYVGMPVSVSVWSASQELLNANVTEISPVADPYTKTFKVRAELADAPEWLKFGMTASVTLHIPDGKRIYTIPSTALYNHNGLSYVWVVQENTVHLREVAVAKYESTTVKINQGLGDNDYIVSAGVHKLFDRQEVRVIYPDDGHE